jgi:hypothetical protein
MAAAAAAKREMGGRGAPKTSEEAKARLNKLVGAAPALLVAFGRFALGHFRLALEGFQFALECFRLALECVFFALGRVCLLQKASVSLSVWCCCALLHSGRTGGGAEPDPPAGGAARPAGGPPGHGAAGGADVAGGGGGGGSGCARSVTFGHSMGPSPLATP